jgi:hypothetical protein
MLSEAFTYGAAYLFGFGFATIRSATAPVTHMPPEASTSSRYRYFLLVIFWDIDVIVVFQFFDYDWCFLVNRERWGEKAALMMPLCFYFSVSIKKRYYHYTRICDYFIYTVIAGFICYMVLSPRRRRRSAQPPACRTTPLLLRHL